MRTRSRRVPLLAACAFALAVSLSAQADPPDGKPAVPTAVAVPPTGPQIAGAPTSPEGQRLAAELEELEGTLVKHLKGEKPSSFQELDARRQELKNRLAGMTMPSADRKILDDRINRAGSVIIRSLRLTGGGPTLDPEVRKAVIRAGATDPAAQQDPLYAFDRLLGDLDMASANPAEAEKIFDNLNRRYNSPDKGPAAVNFGAIKKTLADTWSFTPAGAPGTNAAKARDLSRPTPVPENAAAVKPAVPVAEGIDYLALLSLTGGRAAETITQKILPDGAERRFVSERGTRLKELLDVGRLAVTRMGGDPDTFKNLDELVAHLVAQEKSMAAALGLSDKYDSMDDVMRRVTAIKGTNRTLGAFMATLWEYRAFLRQQLVAAQVPLKTKFTPWETFPDGQGTVGAEVVGLTRGVSQFVGLRYDKADGSSRFQGQGRDGKSGLIIAIDSKKIRTESLIGYDAEGGVSSALTEVYDGKRRTHRELLNMATGNVEITDYKADGSELKTTRQNTKSGEQFVRDLGREEGGFEATTRDGRREIRFLKSAAGVAPAISLRIEKVGVDGTFELDRLVLQNGTHIVSRAEHVTEILEGGKKTLGFDVAVKSLVDTKDEAARLTLGRRLAKESLLAMGLNDDGNRLSNSIGAFLAAEARDTGGLIKPTEGAPVRFFISMKDGLRTYMLIFTNANGTKRILSGTIKEATPFEGNTKLGNSFAVAGEITVDAAEKATQNDPRIVSEYLFDGSRLTWLPPPAVPPRYTPTTNLGWLGKWEMPWTNEHEKIEFKVRRDIPPDIAKAVWSTNGRIWVSAKDTIDHELDGTSTFGSASRAVAGVWGVKHVLGFCGDVASTLYTGIVSGGQMGAYLITGNEEYKLEATAGYSRNPGVKLLMGGSEPDRLLKDGTPNPAWRKWKDRMNNEYLSRMGGGDNQMILDTQAKQRREKALALQGITESRAPQAYRAAMNAPVNDDERYDALSDFGAGTYGRRLAEDGHEVLGGLMSFGESLGEGLLNPLMYVIPGVGRLASGIGKLGIGAGTTGRLLATVGEFGVTAFQWALLGSVVGSFTLSALDNIGKVSDYWGTPGASVKAGEAMADLAFGGMMIRGFAKERTRDRLAELKQLGGDTKPVDLKPDVNAALNAIDAKPTIETKAPVVEAQALSKGPTGEGPVVDLKGKGTAEATPAVVEAPKVSMGERVSSFAANFWSQLKRGGDAFKDEGPRPELNESTIKSNTRAEANSGGGGNGGATLDTKTADLKANPIETSKGASAAEVSNPVDLKADVKADPKGTKVEANPTAKAEIVAPEVKSEVAKPEIKSETAKPEVLKPEIKSEVAKPEVLKPEIKSEVAKPEVKSEKVQPKTEVVEGEGKGKPKGKGDVKEKGKTETETKEKTPGEQRLEELAKEDQKRNRANLQEEGKSKGFEEGRERERARMEEREANRGEEGKLEEKLKPEEKKGLARRAGGWMKEKANRMSDRLEKGSRWLEKRPIMRLGRGTVPLPITRAMKANMTPDEGRRGKNDRKNPSEEETRLIPVEDPAAEPPKDPAPDEQRVVEDENTPGDDRRELSRDMGGRRPAPRTAPSVGRNNSGSGPGGAGGEEPGGKGGPKAPSGLSFGGGKGGGGGGGGGGGAPSAPDFGGNGGDGGFSPGAGGGKGGPMISPAVPEGLAGGGPVIPARPGQRAVPNTTGGPAGGHSPEPSLASRFDGSRDRSQQSPGWSPTPMKGLGAGDSPGLPRIAARAGPLAAPASADTGVQDSKTAGGAVPTAARPAGAPGARPEEEDFNYTYMAPARHKYELPEDRPKEGDDWRALLSLALRGAAALSIAYLIYHSDLPYLVGLTRRRRDGSYGA